MLADSIPDEPARAEGGQETAGSSRSTIIILRPVPNVQLAQHHVNPACSKGSNRSGGSSRSIASLRLRVATLMAGAPFKACRRFKVQGSTTKLRPKVQGKTNSVDASTFRQFPKRRNDRRLCSSVPRGFFLNQESYLAALLLRRRHDLPDRLEDRLDLFVVSADLSLQIY